MGGGGGGWRSPPLICKHNARMMGFRQTHMLRRPPMCKIAKKITCFPAANTMYVFFSCCRPWDAFCFAVVLGARFLSGCCPWGAFSFFSVVAGARVYFVVVAGAGVHLLAGFLGLRTDNKNQHKATRATKTIRVPILECRVSILGMLRFGKVSPITVPITLWVVHLLPTDPLTYIVWQSAQERLRLALRLHFSNEPPETP